jgi:hypothetical protein
MTTLSVEARRFGECLVRFQSGDSTGIAEFEVLVRPYLTNLARKIGRQLPDDIQEEIVQQTCLDLLGNSKLKFDPRRATAKKFLVLAVRNAFRKVRADYCPPGNTSRPRKSKDQKTIQTVVSIEDLDESKYATSCWQEVITRSEVNSLLRFAPPPVALSLERIYYSGDKLFEVAEDLDISRFKLSREIAAYFEQMQIIGSFGNVTFSHRLTC